MADKLEMKHKGKLLPAAMLILGAIKFLLVEQLPMWVLVNTPNDDALMIKLSESLFNGNWLGQYDSNTLVKGVMSPLFVALVRKIGMSYSTGLALLYIFACVLFCVAIRPLIKKDAVLIGVYALLLFNPASMDSYSFQKIYRSALTPAQVLLVFGCFFALYLACRNGTKKLLWALAAGVSLAFFWYTREDSIWMMPFVLVITLLSIIEIVSGLKNDSRNLVKGLAVLCVPFVVFFCIKSGISAMNYKYYGIRTTNEVNDSAFTDAIESFYAVKPEEKIHWVTVTREKLDRIYEVSPTLAGIREQLETCMDGWSNTDRTVGDGEVEDGWFFWVLRDAAQRAGYYANAQTANDFYRQVADEIQQALNDGRLERQPTMPSALMPPWRSDSIPELKQAVLDSCSLLFRFKDTQARAITTDISGENFEKVRTFYKMTGSPILVQTPGSIDISGWVFSNAIDAPVTVELYDGSTDTFVAQIPLQTSEDVAEYYGTPTQASKNCRFQITVDTQALSDNLNDYFVLVTAEDGSKCTIYPSGEIKSDGTFSASMDVFKFSDTDPAIEMATDYVDRANAISSIYQNLNMIVMVAALLCYLLLIIRVIIGAVHKNLTRAEWDHCVFATAVLASLCVLILGVSYNQTFSCHSIQPLYYSGAYSLILSFEGMALVFAVKTIFAFVETKKCK